MRRGLIALYVLMLSLAAINYAGRVVLSVAARPSRPSSISPP